MEKTTENIIRKIHLQKTFKELATEMFVFTNRYQHKYDQKLNQYVLENEPKELKHYVSFALG